MAIEGLDGSMRAAMTINNMQNVKPVVTSVDTSTNTQVTGAYGQDKIANKKNQNNQIKEDDTKTLQEVSPEKVESALREVNKKIKPTHTECQFAYHEETNRISIKVIDQSTKEVIKEIPPEKTLDMIAKMWEMAGILVDEKR